MREGQMDRQGKCWGVVHGPGKAATAEEGPQGNRAGPKIHGSSPATGGKRGRIWYMAVVDWGGVGCGELCVRCNAVN